MTQINHLDKELLSVGEVLSFNFKGKNFKVESVDFARPSFRVVQVNSEYPLLPLDYQEMLSELQMESDEWVNDRDEDIREEAQEEDGDVTLPIEVDG